MSTVIVRRVAATPNRTAGQTWEKIQEILAPNPSSEARRILVKAAGVACASISSEATKSAAVVVWGGGPRVRIYCVFGEDAITGDGVNEDALPNSPTISNWELSIPCPPEDVPWSNLKLAAISNRISARSFEDDVDADESPAASSAKSMTINEEEFFKP